MNVKAIEWVGCGAGLIGALLLALNTKISGLGFIFFLLSNLCWIAFALKANSKGLLVTQVGFTATSLIGLIRWLA